MTRVREVSGSTRSRVTATLCAGLLVAALTGCGDGGEEPAGASNAPAPAPGAFTDSAAPPVTSAPVAPSSAVDTSTAEGTLRAAPPEEEPVAEDDSDASALWGTRYSGIAELSVDVGTTTTWMEARLVVDGDGPPRLDLIRAAVQALRAVTGCRASASTSSTTMRLSLGLRER